VSNGEHRLARVAAFGKRLHQERELRGLPRQEVARLTKLAPAVIEALESGDASRMPPRAYVIGYLRSYAGAVGLDADDLVLRWQEADGPEAGATAATRKTGRVLRIAVGTLAGAVLLGLVLGLLFARRPRPLSAPERPARPAERLPAAQ
jgi:transcriptional regulator with XRE-family HTH domain